MKNFKNFKELSNDTLNKIKNFGITSKTVISYFESCSKELNVLMDQNNIVFSKELALSWLTSSNFASCQKKGSFRRTILLLSDNYEGVLHEWKIYRSIHASFPVSSDYQNLIYRYNDYLIKLGFRQETIKFKINCAKNMLIYLETLSIFNISQCTHQILANYYSSNHFKNRKPSGVNAEILRTNHFIIYLEDNNLVNPTLHFTAPLLHVKESKIVSTISAEIEKIILDDFPSFPSNLRNKAIYLLALRCGLRRVDIINLKFSNIDWTNNLINIIQIKTDIPLIIPMDNETSNAIIDYILNERKECDIDYIFVTSQAPFRKLKGFSLEFSKRLYNVSEDKLPQEFGTHILRRTFASNLLNTGASLAVISSALGQVDKDRVNKYLSTDDMNMKICALEIDEIPYAGGLIK